MFIHGKCTTIFSDDGSNFIHDRSELKHIHIYLEKHRAGKR